MAATNDPPVCRECGFENASVTPGNGEGVIRSLASRYRAALHDGAASTVRLRQRPDATTWSALEYAAHMRDVVAYWSWAVHRILTEEQPRLPTPDPKRGERTAAASDYAGQDPLTVERELEANVERMAKKVATVSPEQWQCTALYGVSEVTTLWMVRHTAHEGHHHLLDVRRALEQAD